MARSRLPDSARVPIGLKVTEDDASRIDQVLARPEFTGWTRAEWCREIIRTALRYYVGNPSAPDPGQARTPAHDQPATARPASPRAEPPAVPQARGPAPAEDKPAEDKPVPSAQPECRHPADARDYETGTCAVCGAILWD
jgi:hypothetical protein